MKYKNDVSFLIDKTLSLYEHQSSYNPNMPLRGFLYYADLYRKLIHRSERLYSKHLLKIPRPHFIVFYNGSEKELAEERRILRLSDAFETDTGAGEYEWTATMININSGKISPSWTAAMFYMNMRSLLQRSKNTGIPWN